MSAAETQALSSAPQTRRAPAITGRAIAVGLASITGVVFLIHWAELVLGGARGHTAMANTSIPVGAFTALIVILVFNGALGRIRRRWQLNESELILIYTMTAVSTGLASSGAIHFMVPALAAPYYFASDENKWEGLFHQYIPEWIGPTNLRLLERFFDGGDTVPVGIWLGPSVVWCLFIFLYALCSLSIAALVRRQWVESERLTFPTVYVPLNITAADGSFWRNRLAWIGIAIPFLIGTLNTLNLNFPTIPKLEVRNIDVSSTFKDPPWNAMGGLQLSLYPFVIGIAFLLSSEVTFSAWFFFLATKAERVMGAIFGLSDWGTGALTKFPFEEHQGAGAFIAISAIALWIGRKQLAHTFAVALGLAEAKPEWHVGPRWAVWCALASFAGMMIFCRAAGMSFIMPALLLVLSLVYLVAATRIRAETGNAWLFGPRIDPQTILVTSLGSRNIGPKDLTIMAYLSNFASFDMRCVSMPHQLDAYKMAEVRNIPRGGLTGALTAALAFGIPVAFWGALAVWHNVGALAKGNTWRTLMGKSVFDRLQGYLQAPQPPDLLGLVFVGVGALITAVLFILRTQFVAWPLHPVGYAIAGTQSMRSQWFPFLIAWTVKTVILRYGGPRMYRQALPFFFGLVVGDFLNGGFYTLIACFISKMNVYPVNW